MNLAGSAGLAANGAVDDAWPSTALNLLWLILALNVLRRRRATPLGATNTGPVPIDDRSWTRTVGARRNTRSCGSRWVRHRGGRSG